MPSKEQGLLERTATDLARKVIAVALRWQEAEDAVYGPSLGATKAETVINALAAKGLAIAGPGQRVVDAEDVEYILHYVNDTLPNSAPYWQTRSTISERCDRLRAALSDPTTADQPTVEESDAGAE